MPLLFGIWIPDRWQGEKTCLYIKGDAPSSFQCKLTQNLRDFDGYVRNFYYTTDGHSWYCHFIGMDDSVLWNPTVRYPLDFSEIRIFDGKTEIAYLQWDQSLKIYVKCYENGERMLGDRIPHEVVNVE
jgi:hypothetical protein